MKHTNTQITRPIHRKLLAVLLAALMALSIVPLSALAEDLTTPKGQVALVIYGSEFTELVAEEKGTVETLQQMGNATVKTIVKVPEVTVTLTSQSTGETYTLDPVKEDVMNSVTFRSSVLEDARAALDNVPVAGKVVGSVEQFIAKQKDTFLQGFRGLSDLCGAAYATYKSERIPVGTYDVHVEEVDKDGFQLTDKVRKDWSVDVVEQTGNRPQYLGTTRTLGGELEPIDLSALASNSVIDLSALTDTAKNILMNTDPVAFDYALEFPGLWAADKDAGFEFKNTDLAGNAIKGSTFVLLNRDEVCNVLNFIAAVGATPYNMIMKAVWGSGEQGILPFGDVLALQKELLKNDSGSLSLNEDAAYAIVKSYTSLLGDADILGLALRQNVVVPGVLKTKSRTDGRVVFDPNTNVTLTWMLDLLPVIIKASAKIADLGIDLAETAINTAASTATATAASTAVAQPVAGAATGAVGGIAISAVTDALNPVSIDQLADILASLVDYANTLVQPAVAELLYPFAQRLGLVGPKLGAGHYLLFQSKAADNYLPNPLAYTLTLNWIDPEDIYVTVASLGILTPVFAEGLYEHIRNTPVTETVDRALSLLTRRKTTLVSDLFGGNVDVTAASIAYAAHIAYTLLGGNTLYLSEQKMADILTFFLYKQGRTAQNVLMYFTRIAERSKSVFAGYVDSDWAFYNLDENLTLTAPKVMAGVTKDIGNIVATTMAS